MGLLSPPWTTTSRGFFRTKTCSSRVSVRSVARFCTCLGMASTMTTVVTTTPARCFMLVRHIRRPNSPATVKLCLAHPIAPGALCRCTSYPRGAPGNFPAGKMAATASGRPTPLDLPAVPPRTRGTRCRWRHWFLHVPSSGTRAARSGTSVASSISSAASRIKLASAPCAA